MLIHMLKPYLLELMGGPYSLKFVNPGYFSIGSCPKKGYHTLCTDFKGKSMLSKTMPFALPDYFCDRIQRDPSDGRDEFWFLFKDTNLLVDQKTMRPFQTKIPSLKHSIYMGTFEEFHLYAGEVGETPLGGIWMDLKALYGRMNDAFVALAGRAIQLISWNRTHQFCGQCGSKTSEKMNERAKECHTCQLLTYPKICPVMMVLVQKGDEVLLARGVNFPAGFYSALAGFVDAGETLEQCVKREVSEEVGLEIDNIKYFASQSWPFPNSLMIAFTCDWKSGEIKIDPSEIIDAQWFKKENLPLLPPKISISRILIDSILESS